MGGHESCKGCLLGLASWAVASGDFGDRPRERRIRRWTVSRRKAEGRSQTVLGTLMNRKLIRLPTTRFNLRQIWLLCRFPATPPTTSCRRRLQSTPLPRPLMPKGSVRIPEDERPPIGPSPRFAQRRSRPIRKLSLRGKKASTRRRKAPRPAPRRVRQTVMPDRRERSAAGGLKAVRCLKHQLSRTNTSGSTHLRQAKHPIGPRDPSMPAEEGEAEAARAPRDRNLAVPPPDALGQN